jgi:hypothetical protein
MDQPIWTDLRTDTRAALPPVETEAVIRGTAWLAARVMQGMGLDALFDALGPAPRTERALAAWLLDRSVAHALCFQPEQAAALQAAALSITRHYRVAGGAATTGPTLLALTAPGNLMVNTPLDFLTNPTGVRLDLLYVDADVPARAMLPPHDVAIVAVSDAAPSVLDALAPAYPVWPRPILNDPSRIHALVRDRLAATLAGQSGLCVAPTLRAERAVLAKGLSPVADWPQLLRPTGAHGGQGLMLVDGPSALREAVAGSEAAEFFVCPFIDTRGADGFYRKYRIAFVDGAPFLCHMAVSEHWMVHYLSAGMETNAAKRDAEAAAMAEFETGFAVRHAAALATLDRLIGLDYFSIDCAETNDGWLLVFEADVAAIIHDMDDPALFPYKSPAMRRCFAAFAALIARRTSGGATSGRLPLSPRLLHAPAL